MKNRGSRRLFNPYNFIVTFPERVYPFSTLVDGKKVRWVRSYEYRLQTIQKKLGSGRYGLRLGTYRQIFHLLGAALVILIGTVFSKYFFGDNVAIPVLFVLAMLVITYQEFVLQPKTYNQHLGKSITDWFSWGLPLLFYLFFLLK